jgi:hypothetical protein
VALIANWHIAKGQVIAPTVVPTRTEEDFCEHIKKTIETDPEAGWIFLVSCPYERPVFYLIENRYRVLLIESNLLLNHSPPNHRFPART